MKKQRYIFGAAGLLCLLLAWQIGTFFLGQSLPIAKSLAPVETFESLWYLISSHEIDHHVLASLKRVAIGLGAALVIGVPLGLLLGFSQKVEMFCTPPFQLLRMVSPLSWMPIVVMLLGIGDLPIYFLLVFAAVWSLIISTSAGVKSIDSQWILLGRSMAASRGELFRKIIFPAIGSHILTGLRVSMGIVWVVLVPCEMLGVNEGLGYFILDTRDRLAYSELMAAVVLIGAIGWSLDSLIRCALGKLGR
ncbi:ABC transporter permease [Conservatibacter flavescens]|uniref:ABC transporter permease n=1 Tax=Conservatibacter flavescens TaxID=28161 RepID=A0A2M8S0B0_9PAST|nr:ABC transporter permease [Conservatibacter flavescens]PJG84579.1 ABC transporter permease [Conservatibacter flavescens]